MLRKRALSQLICGLGLFAPFGCQSNSVRTLDSALFVPPTAGGGSVDLPIDSGAGKVAETPAPPSTQGGELPKNASILPLPALVSPFADIKPVDPLQSPTTLPSEAPGADSTPPAIAASAVMAPPAPAPTPVAVHGSVGQSQGVYLTVGGVLAVVNGTPIYADKVLARLNKEFIAKAREMSVDDFHAFAEQEIARQLREMIDDELYFGTAYNALNEEDRKWAKAVAMHVRQKKVTAAGGSVEEARRRASQDGTEFDESLQQDYRRIVSELYEQKRIDPLIQVTANDMREFYRLNVDKRYSDQDGIQFLQIDIDPAAHGGLQPAMDLISGIREKALRGEDFTALASDQNDNALLKNQGGNPGKPDEWKRRNSYPNEALEAAVWKIEPGQVTPVVQANGLLSIAKVKAKHLGVTKPFDDQTVQQDIYEHIYQAQYSDLWEKRKYESRASGMVSTDRERFELAVDMAMQKYAQCQ